MNAGGETYRERTERFEDFPGSDKGLSSPTPAGDDIEEFDLAEQRFKASWDFRGPESASTLGDSNVQVEGSTTQRPKRRTRASLEGGAPTPIKRSTANIPRQGSPAAHIKEHALFVPRRRVVMENKGDKALEAVSGFAVLAVGLLVVLLWVICVGVDSFWDD